MDKFLICWNRPSARWIVRCGDEVRGDYLSKNQATLDAIAAAGEARRAGHDAQVWDEATAARVF